MRCVAKDVGLHARLCMVKNVKTENRRIKKKNCLYIRVQTPKVNLQLRQRERVRGVGSCINCIITSGDAIGLDTVFCISTDPHSVKINKWKECLGALCVYSSLLSLLMQPLRSFRLREDFFFSHFLRTLSFCVC